MVSRELRSLPLGVAPLEPLHPAARVHQLLLARVERVAVRADLHAELRLGGARGERVPARAVHRCGDVLGMYALFHLSITPLLKDSASHSSVRSLPSIPRRSGGTPDGRCGIPAA